MDLRHYYRKLRETEQSLTDEYLLIVSLETSDGGKAGRVIEVSRAVAAKMIVDGRAALANAEQRDTYLSGVEAARLAAQKADFARRVQVAIVSEDDLAAGSLGKRSK